MKDETAAWLASAESDRGAASVLLMNGYYSQAVFYTHLWVEKTLKGAVAERSPLGMVPRSHDLLRLLETSNLQPPPWLVAFLGTLAIQTTASRYTLSPASSVYTAELAQGLLQGSYEATEWLRQQLT